MRQRQVAARAVAPLRALLCLAVATALAWRGLRAWGFLAGPRGRTARAEPQSRTAVAAVATQLDAAAVAGAPAAAVQEVVSTLGGDFPNTLEAMAREAAETVMNAYRSGNKRQVVQLRLDIGSNTPDEIFRRGMYIRFNETIPTVKDFVGQLMPEVPMKDLKVQFVDDQSSTMVYREAEDPMWDSACFFLAGRDTVVSGESEAFFKDMGDRLVVLANNEDSAATWRLENKGLDFLGVSKSDRAQAVQKDFNEYTYYFKRILLNQWQTVFYRKWPDAWQVWVQDFEYKWLKLATFDQVDKPDYDKVIEKMEEYERENNIIFLKKMSKAVKDNAPIGMGDPNAPADA